MPQKGVQAAGLGFALHVGHASMHVSIGTDADLLCRGSLVHIKGVVVPSGRALGPGGATPGRLPRSTSSARSRQAASQNSGPRVATCSGRADSTSCWSSCSALLQRLQLEQKHRGPRVCLSAPAKQGGGMSHSRMGHQLCAWPIWPTCSVPGPGLGLGSSNGPIPSLEKTSEIIKSNRNLSTLP